MKVVYFLRADHTSLVKIGWTSNIVQRVSRIRAITPGDVKLVGVRPGGEDLEAGYHQQFSSYREHGEWFRFDYEIIAWMERFFRTEYAEAWQEVERLFREQAPELLEIKDKYGDVSSVLNQYVGTVDEAYRPRRRHRVEQEGGGGNE